MKNYVVPEGTAYNVDWEEYRRDVAKDVLCAICCNWGRGFAGKRREIPEVAVELADILIEQLKKGEK